MRKLVLIGRKSEAGKTTLTQALRGEKYIIIKHNM